MRDAMNRMVDMAIGYGVVFVEYKDLSLGISRTAELPFCGTLYAEDVLASLAAKAIRRFLPEANPVAVRLVMLRGTWSESPLWTRHWHRV